MYAYIAVRTMCFMQNIYHHPGIYKHLLIDRIVELLHNNHNNRPNSPIAWFVMSCIKYGLIDDIKDMIASGVATPKAVWKTKCINAVTVYEGKIRKIEKFLYKKNGYIPEDSEMDIWWHVAFEYPELLAACRLMIKFKVCEEPLLCNTGLYEGKEAELRTCLLCDLGVEENAEHFMFECKALADARKLFHRAVCQMSDDGIRIIQNQSLVEILNPDPQVTLEDLAAVANALHEMLRVRNAAVNAQEENTIT